MPQPNTKTKYRPLPAALLTLVVLLASTLLIWLAVVRPQLGKGRTETLCDNFDRSELLADGDTAAQVFTYDKALYTIGLEFYLPGAQPQGELEVVLSDADTGEELARSTGVMQNIIPDQYTTLGLDPVVPAQEGRRYRLSVTAHYTSDAVLAIGHSNGVALWKEQMTLNGEPVDGTLAMQVTYQRGSFCWRAARPRCWRPLPCMPASAAKYRCTALFLYWCWALASSTRSFCRPTPHRMKSTTSTKALP